MVTTESQALAYSILDANNEYNTKVLLLCLIFIYLVFTLWAANKIIPYKSTMDQRDSFPVYQQISVKLMRVGSTAFLIFYPLIIGIMMYREYDIDSLITLMVTGYSVLTMVGIGIWFLFGMHWVQDLLRLIGVETGDKKGTIIRRKD